MAVNLVKAGFEVTGYNRSDAPVRALEAAGGIRADSVRELTVRSDVVVTVLPDSPDVEAVVLGPDGVLSNAAAGMLLIDFSTIRPATSQAVAEASRAAGVSVLDAPVSGGERGAKDATLSIMVGGSAADFERAQSVLKAVGTTIVRVGDAGAGQTVKAANQLLVGGILGLVSEAIVLLEASGIDPTPALQVLAGGLAGNRVLETKGAAMLARDFRPGFRIDLHHKDLGLAIAAAREAGVAVPLTGLVAQLMASARARGSGSLDHGALLRLIEELSGRR
jgi:2-hydroxy-3-oxopropionate reductase